MLRRLLVLLIISFCLAQAQNARGENDGRERATGIETGEELAARLTALEKRSERTRNGVIVLMVAIGMWLVGWLGVWIGIMWESRTNKDAARYRKLVELFEWRDTQQRRYWLPSSGRN